MTQFSHILPKWQHTSIPHTNGYCFHISIGRINTTYLLVNLINMKGMCNAPILLDIRNHTMPFSTEKAMTIFSYIDCLKIRSCRTKFALQITEMS